MLLFQYALLATTIHLAVTVRDASQRMPLWVGRGSTAITTNLVPALASTGRPLTPEPIGGSFYPEFEEIHRAKTPFATLPFLKKLEILRRTLK